MILNIQIVLSFLRYPHTFDKIKCRSIRITVYKVLDLKLMYAHTFGSNPAAINGKNSDGTSDQSRLLFF